MRRRRLGWFALVLGTAGLVWWVWPHRPMLTRGPARAVLDEPSAEGWSMTLERGGVAVGRLVSIHVDPAATDPRLVLNRGRAPLNALAPGADVVANAGFFTPEFRPTGLLVSEGEVLHPFVDHGGGAGTGVLVWRSGGRIELVAREAFELRDPEAIRIAVQAGPRLIEPDGRPGIRSNDRIGARRTVVGRDRAGRFVVAVAHAAPSRSGPSLWEMMNLLGSAGLGAIREDLALEIALNLDGGPSTGLRVDAADVDVPPAEPVTSALVLELAE